VISERAEEIGSRVATVPDLLEYEWGRWVVLPLVHCTPIKGLSGEMGLAERCINRLVSLKGKGAKIFRCFIYFLSY
jgi:hypothetical protein